MKLHATDVLEDLRAAAEGVGVGMRNDAVFDGVMTDSRAEVAGTLFVALAGERFDAHEFVPDVVARGARGVVVRAAALDTLPPGDYVRYGVSDTLVGLQAIAAASLRRVRPRVVAITGSNGKTTTKDLTVAALAPFGAVHGTRGNLNNHIGVPLTILSRRGDEKFLVAEAGTSGFGELELLSRILQPDVVVITNIGRAHLETLGNQDGVLRAKAELLSSLQAGGVAVLNADDPYFPRLVEAAPGARIASFGFDARATYRIEAQQPLDAGSQELTIRGVRFGLQRPGRANALNAAAALAVAVESGGNLERAAAALRNAAFTSQRSAWVRLGGFDVLDDTYNANPDSMAQAVELLAARPGRRIAILGDMLELGTETAALHAALGSQVAAAGIDLFFACGPHMAHAVGAASAAGMGARARHFATLEPLVVALQSLVGSGDSILVKGSRGSRMERVVTALAAEVA